MAELLAAGAVVGVVASLVTIADVAWRVLKRLNEYKRRVDNAPIVIVHIIEQLPAILEKILELRRAAERNELVIDTQTALGVAVTSFEGHIKRLDSLMDKMIPLETDSTSRRAKRALYSVYYEKEMAKSWQEVESYKTTLMFFFTPMQVTKEVELPKYMKPIFMVPLERDLNFIGRTSIIKEIEAAMGTRRRAAIAGIGGVGKTQIAIEYCYRFRDEHPEAQVFWVHASAVSKFDQAYKDIATKLLIPGWNNPEADVLKLVCDWLTHDTECSWLLVLDNADDTEIFFPPKDNTGNTQRSVQTKALARYLPHNPKGSILVTTRDMRVGRKLTNGEKPIPVLPMNSEDGKAMLKSRLPDILSDADLDNLLAELEYLPLAISQAAAFINENSITISDYIALLQGDDGNILNTEFDDWRRDPDTQNSIVRTWKLSFDQIRRQEQRAAELLSLMAVLDRQGLQSSLICDGHELETEFVTALGILQAFSLIAAEKAGSVFQMHRLVQLSTRKWLEIERSLSKWEEQGLNILVDKFPEGAPENWPVCQAYYPHAQAILSFSFQTEPSLLQKAKLLCATAEFDYEQARYDPAFEKYKEASEIRTKFLGAEHPDTLMCSYYIGMIYDDQGRYPEAKDLHSTVLELRKKVLGENHPDTLMSMNDLGVVYTHQGNYEEAEELDLQVFERRKTYLGKEHPDTLESMNNLAWTYGSRDKYEEAEAIFTPLLELSNRILGENHKETLRYKDNSGLVLFYKGKLDEAEKLQKEALEGRRKILGDEHPDTLISINNLALVYQGQSKYLEAEKLYEPLVEISRRILGDKHKESLTGMSNLALNYYYLGKYQKAEDMLLFCLTKRRKTLGLEHPDTLANMDDLGYIYYGQGKYKEAEAIWKPLLELRSKVNGEEHLYTLQTIKNLASSLQGQGKYKEAGPLHEKLVALCKKVHGEEHVETLNSLADLASDYSETGKFEKAQAILTPLLEARTRILGAEHADTLETKDQLDTVVEALKGAQTRTGSES